MATELRDENTQLKRRVAELQDQVARPRHDFKKVHVADGSGGGAHLWPHWMVQLVIEQLLNGTPPSAIPSNIISQEALTSYGSEEVQVPSESFCCSMRTVIRIIAETLAAYRLGKTDVWKQLFTDGTSRRQVALQTLFIAIDEEDDNILPLILTTAFVVEGGLAYGAGRPGVAHDAARRRWARNKSSRLHTDITRARC